MNERTNGLTDIRITIYPGNIVCGGYNEVFTFKGHGLFVQL